MFGNFFNFVKSFSLRDVEEYCRAGQAVANMVHAHCMLLRLQTHTHNITHIASPLQQWLHECTQ